MGYLQGSRIVFADWSNSPECTYGERGTTPLIRWRFTSVERYQFSILNTPFESEFGVFDVWCCYGPYDRLPSHSLSLPLPLPLPIHECALSLRNIKCGCRSSCSLDHDVPSKFRVTIFQWTCIRLYALWHNMPCSPRLLMCSHVVLAYVFACGPLRMRIRLRGTTGEWWHTQVRP